MGGQTGLLSHLNINGVCLDLAQAIGVVRPTMIVMLCANVFNAIMCFIFIGHLRMGLDGAVLVLVWLDFSENHP